MRADYITITAPALPLVYEYLTVHYGNPVDFISAPSVPADYLRLLLERHGAKDLSNYANGPMTEYSCELTMHVPMAWYKKHGPILTRTAAVKFNHHIRRMIMDLIRQELYYSFIMTGKRRSGFESARSKLALSMERFPYDAANKDFTRLLKNRPHIFNKKIVTVVSTMVSTNNKHIWQP